jgi:hypothetical protein
MNPKPKKVTHYVYWEELSLEGKTIVSKEFNTMLQAAAFAASLVARDHCSNIYLNTLSTVEYKGVPNEIIIK